MLELRKTDKCMFDEYYEGTAVDGWKVHCILDDYCVRYMVFDNMGKRKKRREYRNDQKERCFAMATKELARI